MDKVEKKEKVKKEDCKNDTIAAISTAKGRGAISCIRISGGKSEEIVKKLTDYPFTAQKKHARMVPCKFTGRIRDKIMAVLYYGTKSYTGEESAEIYFHGGAYLTEQALLSILDSGARLAEAGEFTRRAFLNGKIDLTQAEGIGDLIDGDSTAALEAAYEQSEGKTKTAVNKLYEKLTETAAQAEVCIDYPEEDIEEQTLPQLREKIDAVVKEVQAELGGYNSGRIKREGARVVLTGKTNAGKSTLFNTLLQTERAIVSDEEGTTRDTIEEKLRYKGISYVLVDTAGIRDTASKVEKMGIERSKTALQNADLIVHVTRDTENTARQDTAEKNTVYVVNTEHDVENGAGANGVIVLNAKSGAGVQALQEKIYEIIQEKTAQAGNITNERQYAALQEAQSCLLRAYAATQTLTLDCVCSDLLGALAALGKITGQNASESVITEIFSKFCVGK